MRRKAETLLPCSHATTPEDRRALSKGLCPLCGSELLRTSYGFCCGSQLHGPHWGLTTIAECMKIKVTYEMRSTDVARLIRMRIQEIRSSRG